jgi:hypothetical protein
VITNAANTKMVETVAALVQALSLSQLALNYDKAFIVTDSTPRDPANNNAPIVTFKSRTALRDTALAKFDQTIALATANTFDVPSSFFNNPGVTYNNVRIAQIARTMAARTLAYFPRDAAENAAVDWARVATYAAGGMSSGTPFDVTFTHDGCVNWCDYLKAWSNDMGTMRMHTRVAHLMDPTTQPDPWADEAANSQPVWGTTSFDRRLGDGTAFSGDYAADITATPDATPNAGTDYAWSFAKEIFPAARGQWHQSAIGQIRYITLSGIDPNGSAFGFGPGPVVLAAENDLLWAEGLIRSGGDLVLAAAKINNTRVTRGGLSPAPSAAGLLADLQYEQDVELPGSNAAPFYNMRRTDRLEPFTAREMPVPAKELGVLQMPLYTFGGASAPNSNPAAPVPALSAQNVQRVWAEMEHRLLMPGRAQGFRK